MTSDSNLSETPELGLGDPRVGHSKRFANPVLFVILENHDETSVDTRDLFSTHQRDFDKKSIVTHLDPGPLAGISSQAIRNMHFSAKLLFEARPLAHGDTAVSIEERIVLLDVPDESIAASEAESIGKSEEFEYEAADGGMVTVKFLSVMNIC